MQRTETQATSVTLQLTRTLGSATIAMASGAVLAAFFSLSAARAQGQGDNGQKIFMQSSCFVCHGQEGFGGVGPAFRNNPFLKLTDYVVGQIIIGRAVMPPYGNKLDDKQIADVATYIRNSWGNHFGDVKPEQVTEVRRELSAAGQQAASPSQQTTGSAPQSGAKAPGNVPQNSGNHSK